MVWNCSIVAVTLLFGVSGKSKAFRNESKTIGEKAERSGISFAIYNITYPTQSFNFFAQHLPLLINIFVFPELFVSIVAITFSAGYNKKELSTTSKEGFL